ncbi:MAG: ATP-binding cassette subfamily B multidrug efflux pump [Bradymonadia bacterium]|jgi:ATP-binding cassette subfamily B multidrug efflux pump
MALLLRFWRDYPNRYRLFYGLGLLCLLATTGLTVAIPAFVQWAVDALNTGQSATGWAIAVLGAGIGIMIVRTLSRTLFFNPGRAVEFRMKSDMFDHLLKMPQRFFDEMKAGDIISRGTNDANSMRALIGFASLQLFNVIFVLVLTCGRMFSMDVMLTLYCIVPLAISALVLRFAVRKMFAVFAQHIRQVASLSARILETYSGVALLQAYNALPSAMTRFDKENIRLLELAEKLLRIRSWMLPVVSVTGNLCVVIVLFVGGGMVIEDQGFTIGQLAGYIVYVNILVGGIISFGWLIGSVQRGYLGLARMYEVLDAESGRPEPTATLPERPAGGHDIVVSDLSFTHPDADAPVLQNVDFSVAPGETLGIFGLTGSGKSTLLNLLARVYDPPPGSVTISGVDITTVPTQAYWRAVAYVPQEAFLFSKTVAENIALADRPEAVDPARLQQALADAALADDLTGFDKGLDTLVGERGVTVSGGQRQRTALARAFYRDFDVLLLDDVMSAVDHATEHALIKSLYRRTAGRTTLVVSHRISVLAKADRIIVLDEGRLVAEGQHVDLAAGDGPYARAWALQKVVDAAGDTAATDTDTAQPETEAADV